MNNYKVYKHTTPNNKVYIGLTGNSVTKRWNNGKNYRNNKYFYRAIKKYGWENIEHEILEENLTYDDACEREKYYIKLYNSTDLEDGYNHMIGGVLQTEEIKKIMSKNNKNRKKILCLRKIEKLDDYILELDVFNSIIDCSNNCNISITTIANRIKSAKIKDIYYYLIYKTQSYDNYGYLYFELRNMQECTYLNYSDELYYYLKNIWKYNDKIRIIKRYDDDVKEMTEDEWYKSLVNMRIEHERNKMSH